MGEFTRNLLKLTEFPFSYSTIGFLFLIFSHGTNTTELTFNKIGPLLILAGFMATTLSTTDPIGAIQRAILRGLPLVTIEGKSGKRPVIRGPEGATDLLNRSLFGSSILSLFSTPYMISIRYAPQEVKERLNFDWASLYKDLKSRPIFKEIDEEIEIKVLNTLGSNGIDHVSLLLSGLKEQTVGSKWIGREVDRINALVYFIITIFLFILSIQYYPYIVLAPIHVIDQIDEIKTVMTLLTIVALFAVTIRLIILMKGLNEKAMTVFKHLASLDAVKTPESRKLFSRSSDMVERALDEGDWSLAKFGVIRVEEEYTEYFLQELTK